MPGLTIREAVKIAIEALPGDRIDWVVENPKEMKERIFLFVHDYAERRGVILLDEDITSELLQMVKETIERGR